MARRTVLGVQRGSRGQILALCNPFESWSPRAGPDVIDDIRAGRHTYIVSVEAAGQVRPARVIVVGRGAAAGYLRTTADTSAVNNLDGLPRCADLPHVMRPRVRRDIRTLSAEERSAFVAALLELSRRYPELPPGHPEFPRGVDPVSWWFKQDEIHAATHVHEQPSFLPWHRELVNRFEGLLQEVDPALALHYWDWTTDPRRDPDLMTNDFMGSAAGAMGAPFEALYDPTADPHRDSRVPGSARYPPRTVERLLPTSGRSPHQVTIDDLDWSSTPAGRPPPGTDVTVHPDRDVLGPGFDGTEEDQFERMWRALTPQHGLAHAYIGGTIADPHHSFRDPFVFLLHSNVDRLWASWQLRQQGFNHRRAASWRLNPDGTYGGLAQGRIAFPDTDRSVPSQEAEARRELNDPFSPWDGRGGVLPWTLEPERRGARHPDVVRPPLYDRYAWDEELCCSWPALLLAKRLPANDRIQATIEVDAVASTEIQFVLRAGPGVSWWKGLTISPDAEISTENDHRTDTVTVPRSTIDGGGLIFSKAIRWWLFFTPHWRMYHLQDLDWLPPGCRVVFDWQAD